MDLYAFEGRRAGSKIYHGRDGFFYHLTNNREDRSFAYLRCVRYNRKTRPCFGSAKASLYHGVLYHLYPHRHDPNVWYPWVLQLRKQVFSRVRSGDLSPFTEILQEEGERYPLEVTAQVPLGLIESRLNSLRATCRPPVPESLDLLGITLMQQEYRHLTQCANHDESLFAGVCGNFADGTFSLVFICDHMKNFMATRNLIFADGTWRKMFKKPKASQIFTISAIWRYHVIPMLRAVMQRKTEEAYLVLFDYIKILIPGFSPEKIMCDFEEAQTNAWGIAFPNASQDGCLYHYDEAVLRNSKSLGLYQLMKNEPAVSSIVRSTMALPLLAAEEIEAGLEDLGWEAVELGWMDELKSFFRYLETEWIPKKEIVSVHKAIHRTNNASETANKSLNKHIKVARPSCFTVVRSFVKLNDKAIVNLSTLALGLQPSRGRKTSALNNDRKIKSLTMDYELRDITRLQFLHRASRRMQGLYNEFLA